MRKRYTIEIADHSGLVVYCPQELLRDKDINKIAFGSKAIEVDFRMNPKKNNSIVISEMVKKQLLFPDFLIKLHVFVDDHVLNMGPLVGIFTAGFTPFPHRPLGDRTNFFSKLLSVKTKVGAIPFVFGEQHINWDIGTISGYFYHDQNWQSIEVPFPHVIYDRLPNRKSERNPKLVKVKEILQRDYLIPWYNPGFFSKLDIYERLQQEHSVTKYLPETHAFTSFSMIEEMLSKYGHIYLKPVNGSLGLGVHQILFDKIQDEYYCRYQDREGVNRLRKFSSLEGLFKTVLAYRNLDKMIVQQGIHLLRHEQRPIDFRIHTNKDEKGVWHVTALAAKIAGHGSVTTHARSGGEIKTLAEIFKPADCNLFKEKLVNAALLLSKAIANNMEGIIAEIGFDLGIDKHGDVWLFEANSKPGRSIFSHPDLKDFDQLTCKLSLAFAVFLTEQSILHPEEVIKWQ
ncbi:YheC/YheD family protein [Neobacillus sp. DY30]|uniref:YheC/YheD family endospore coat-associated protein n=1 Tax=Neobacillus sp. DY30 TaxID=3047871 RepID=UPI0024C06159|nr:YheC/YheD family protein [Neobacillus sp. DY30]WHY02002.1 YheC/YheD family protein [Neobacillus sp. DY30]